MTLPLDDRGFTLGDGLFETVLWENGELVFWAAHFDRLVRGCAALGLPAPADCDALAIALAAGEQLGLERGAVRLTYTAGSGGRGLDRPSELKPRLVATAAPAPLPTAPASLALVSLRRYERSPTSRFKTLNYLDNVLARREARAAGADEALMLNTRGELACAAAANLFWLKDGVLFTPALDCGVLDGIIRQELITRGRPPVREARCGPEVLGAAEGVYLTNSLIGVRQVGWIDGVEIPIGPNLP